MCAEVAAAVLLIGVPVAFNMAFLATAALPAWLGVTGLSIGVALLIGTLEFVGPNERNGWPLAGAIVPIAYVAWSQWLIALGTFLLV